MPIDTNNGGSPSNTIHSLWKEAIHHAPTFITLRARCEQSLTTGEEETEKTMWGDKKGLLCKSRLH